MTNISGNSIQNRENCVKQTKKLSADLLVQAKKDFSNLYETKIKISLFSLRKALFFNLVQDSKEHSVRNKISPQ